MADAMNPTTDLFATAQGILGDKVTNLFRQQADVSEQQETKKTKAAKEFADVEQKVKVDQAQLAANLAKQSAGAQTAVYKKYEKELMAPAPTIQYSPDTAQGMKNLAVLLPLAGAIFGGKGQLSGIGAINAMNGVLEGHKQGNQDRIALETKNFEQKLNDWKTHIEQVKGALQRAAEVAKINASAAQAQGKVEALKLGAPLIAATYDRDTSTNIANKYEGIADNMLKMVEKEQESVLALKAKEQERLLAIKEKSAAALSGFGPTAELARVIGPEAAMGTDEKSADKVLDRLKSIVQVRNLMEQAKDPQIAFGESQTFAARIANLLQRNLSDTAAANLKGLEGKEVSTSELQAAASKIVDDTGLSPSDKNSVFYKNAIFTILAAERAATGRSFLPVGIVNRLTPLLDPRGLSREAFIQVMKDYESRISEGIPSGIIERGVKNLGGTVQAPSGTTQAPPKIGEKVASKADIERTAQETLKDGETMDAARKRVKKELTKRGWTIQGE